MLLEHKNSEPAMRILMRDIGMTMYVINKVKEKGVSTANLKVNMDWQHLIMNGENLAEYASLLAGEKLLGHQHGNSGWGSFDDDNMVGASFFMQTLELALVLRRYGYGKNGERVGYDLFPYTEDQVEAVKRSIYQWEFIDSLTEKIDDKALKEAQAAHDAVAAYKVVFKALGLDEGFIKKVHASRRKK
jgi:xylose isomerase